MTDGVLGLIKNVYRTIDNPGAYGGKDRLYRAVKEKHPNVRREDVEKFMLKEESYTLYRINKRRFPRLKIRVKGPRKILSVDLADFSRISDHNDGVTFLLVAIDSFSRFLHVVPLKTKSGAEVARALDGILKKSPYGLLFADKGTEWYNRSVQAVVRRYGGKFYSTGSEIKAAIAERVIRTLKGKLYRYLHVKNSWKWIDVVQDFVDVYNDTKHSAFKSLYSPRDVHAGIVSRRVIHRMLYPPVQPARPLYKENDLVRLVQSRATFGRGFYQLNTSEIFRISTVHDERSPVTYSIVDFEGEPVEGVVYEPELVRTQEPETYPFDILRERVRNGRRQLYVQYRNWPPKFRSWIYADEAQANRER